MNVLISLLVATLLMQRAPAATPPPPAVPAPAPAAAPDAPVPGKYQIGPQDQLKITVLDEIDLSTTYRVDSDGTITMNYIGKVAAAGMTLMGASRGMYSFATHLRWTWAIGLGYVASIFVHLWLNAPHFSGVPIPH